jgi:hypothetical protein
MSVLKTLKYWLKPLKMTDPDFGILTFIYVSKWPERSYWECKWQFPSTGTIVGITLDGDESGPRAESRHFYLSLPGRFPQILALCRPVLEQVYKDKKHEPAPSDVFSLFKVSGFGVKDRREDPIQWDVSFEAKGDDYLGVLIRFMGESANPPEVNTC